MNVCPSGCTYSTLSAAAAATQDGDTIVVQPGDYQDCAFLTSNNLTIQGVLDESGNRPHFHDVTCGQKGVLVVQGSNTLIENLELSNSRDPGTGSYNWAGVRFDTTNADANLKLNNVYIHDCDDGVLGNNNTGPFPDIVDIENSIFENLGRMGYAHGMYIGTGITLFILRNSTVYQNAYDGHLVKTRALQGKIECNTIAALDGVNSYAIDIPQGGTYLVQGNIIEQGPNISNSSDLFIDFAEENSNNSPHALQVVNNYFVNDYTSPGAIEINVAANTSGWSQNIFAGTGDVLNLLGYSGPNSFTNFASRAAAGLPSYDGQLQCLPQIP